MLIHKVLPFAPFQESSLSVDSLIGDRISLPNSPRHDTPDSYFHFCLPSYGHTSNQPVFPANLSRQTEKKHTAEYTYTKKDVKEKTCLCAISVRLTLMSIYNRIFITWASTTSSFEHIVCQEQEGRNAQKYGHWFRNTKEKSTYFQSKRNFTTNSISHGQEFIDVK